MAKLSAHGYEVARLKINAKIANTDYEVTISFRSDGHIMRNLKALNIHATGDPHHVYGWKLWKKLPRKSDPSLPSITERQRALYERARAQAEKEGVLIA